MPNQLPTAAAGRGRAQEDDIPTPYRDHCPLCQSSAQVVGHKSGPLTRQDYEIRLCDSCRFGFVANPSHDFADIYNEDYYAGRGADPTVDYVAELQSPRTTIRSSEWKGVIALAATVAPPGRGAKWLDYGCGNGLLVRHVNQSGQYDCVGYDISVITAKARASGTPILTDDELARAEGTFDLVTALEVIEHVPDPIPVLKQIYRLLKPGGAFVYTTGNARPHQHRLLKWGYLRPEIHVSLFAPDNAALALRAAGFVPEPLGYRAGSRDIIRFKTLKNLGVRRVAWWQNLIPWTLLAPMINKRYGVFDFPIGRRPA